MRLFFAYFRVFNFGVFRGFLFAYFCKYDNVNQIVTFASSKVVR